MSNMENINASPGSKLPGTSEMKFYNIWLKALFVPTESSYAEVLASPDISVQRSVVWMASMGFASQLLLACVVSVLYSLVFAAAVSSNSSGSSAGAAGGSVFVTLAVFGLCSSLFVAAFQVVISLGNAALGNILARALGGVGDFRRHYFAVAAYGAPLTPFNLIFSSIPYLNFCTGPLIALYGIFLNVRALKSVHQLTWGKATLASPSVWLGALELCLFCCVLVLYVVVLTNINNSR